MLENTNTIPFDDNIFTMEKRGFFKSEANEGKRINSLYGTSLCRSVSCERQNFAVPGAHRLKLI